MAGASSRRSPRSASGGSALFLLLLLLLPLAAAATGEPPRVYASTYRVDLGALLPGETREGVFRLSNPNLVEARVALQGPPGSWVTLPAQLTLAPGEDREVPYVYRVPPDAQAGDHGEAFVLARPDAAESAARARLVASTAILFTSRTEAVSVASLTAPAFVPPAGTVSGSVGVVNTWREPVQAHVRLVWRDGWGEVVAERVEPVAVGPNGWTSVAYAFAPGAGSPGAHTLEARVEDASPEEAPLGAGQTVPMSLGRREARFSLLSIRDAGDGNATVEIHLENTGDVPVTLQPRVTFRDLLGGAWTLTLDEVTLAPGEARRVHGSILLPPGQYAVELHVEGAGATLQAHEAVPLQLHVRAPAAPVLEALPEAFQPKLSWVPWLLALVGLALLATQRRRLARLAQRLPRRRDPVDDLLARLETDLAHDASLLIDLGSLDARDIECVREAARGWSIAEERVYAGDRAALPLAALAEARAGRLVLVATRDPALDALEAEVARAGGRVERIALPARAGDEARGEAFSFDASSSSP